MEVVVLLPGIVLFLVTPWSVKPFLSGAKRSSPGLLGVQQRNCCSSSALEELTGDLRRVKKLSRFLYTFSTTLRRNGAESAPSLTGGEVSTIATSKLDCLDFLRMDLLSLENHGVGRALLKSPALGFSVSSIVTKKYKYDF
jgi:hypothetical protein